MSGDDSSGKMALNIRHEMKRWWIPISPIDLLNIVIDDFMAS
jgi:hypothetical protein